MAKRWRQSLTKRLKSEANKYMRQLDRLRTKYSMRMESIGRRIEGHFADQMQIDRLCSLAAAAVENPQDAYCQRQFRLLRRQTRVFIASTHGVGINLPPWLAALENEVENYSYQKENKEFESYSPHQGAKLDFEKLQSQLDMLPRRPLFE